MLFTELRFLFFFAVVFGVHWMLRANGLRKSWLLAASYAFYAAWDWRFLSLIVGSTVIDYFVGRRLASASTHRRRWLAVSIVANLGVLATFKYFGFFLDSAVGLLEWLGFTASRPTLSLILPVGISFFTFQTMSYTLDVYRRKLAPVSCFRDFALFVAFFPQLVAGPIVRASAFLPQLTSERRLARVPFRHVIGLFLAGFIKKVCVADRVALFVDPVFADPSAFTAGSIQLAVFLYAVQIYCDFSGYTDMAIATARMLGFRLPRNFNFPYFAANITDFWRRWHMSLSSWLRDYLYISLGGNRGSRIFTYRNLMLTMLLGGLWHGAGWNFVVWGAIHGGALVVHKEWRRRVPALAGPLGAFLGMMLTFQVVCLAWIFFRATSFADAWVLARSYVTFASPGTAELDTFGLVWLVPLVLVHAICALRIPERLVVRMPDWGLAFAYGAASYAAILFVPMSSAPFIYFQF